MACPTNRSEKLNWTWLSGNSHQLSGELPEAAGASQLKGRASL